MYHTRMLEWSHACAPAEPVAQPAPAQVPAQGHAAAPRLHLSSRFGDRRHPIGGRIRHHAGIDIPGRTGSAVLAADEGVVLRAGWAGGYGIMIEIEHGDGLTTRYAHLSQALVAPGAPVSRGQAIGAMGSTGLSTGPHLHFEVRRHGIALDPLDFIGNPVPAAAQPQPAAPLQPLVPYRSRFAQMRENAADDSAAGS